MQAYGELYVKKTGREGRKDKMGQMKLIDFTGM
uniref:Uncharacterized protein n=1 Tax=Rhizophora mucronata TaxID=61149 RepID=A0A2P2QWS6_RHIMU